MSSLFVGFIRHSAGFFPTGNHPKTLGNATRGRRSCARHWHRQTSPSPVIVRHRSANGLGPPPCSLHYRVERSCGPRFVGASLPAYAKSFGLAFVRAPWRRLCRAGGVTRTGVGRGGVWSAATAWLGEPAGTRLAERGKPNLDRAGGGRLILKPDCEGEGRRHSFKAVRWCAACRGRGWASTRASFVPGATGRPGPGGVRSGDNAGRRGLGEGRAGELAPGWLLGSGPEPARRLAQRRKGAAGF